PRERSSRPRTARARLREARPWRDPPSSRDACGRARPPSPNHHSPPMSRHFCFAFVSLCLLGTVVAAPVASAQPGDTATAAASRKSTTGLRRGVVAQTPAIEASLAQFESPVCTTALNDLPADQLGDLFDDYLLPVIFEMLLAPFEGSMNQFVAQLD